MFRNTLTHYQVPKDIKSYAEEPDPYALQADEEDIFLGEESSNVFSIVLKQEIYVRKCCSKNESFIVSLNSCSPYELEFVVPSYVTKQNLFLNISSDQMHIQEGLLTACVPSILERNEFILFESGEIFSSELNEYFHPDNYCIENIVDDTEEPHYVRLTAAYCPNSNFPQPFDPNKVPVRKCCPQGEMVSSENAECTPRTRIADEKWSVPVEFQGVLDSLSINFTSLYEVVAGYPECVLKERGETLDSTWNYEVSESTGYLYIPKLDILTPSYCLDDQHVNGSKISAFAYICLTDENHRKYTQGKPTLVNRDTNSASANAVMPESSWTEMDSASETRIISCSRSQFPFITETELLIINLIFFFLLQVQNIDFSFGIPNCGRRELFMTKEDERAEIMSDGGLRYVSYDPYECSHDNIFLVKRFMFRTLVEVCKARKYNWKEMVVVPDLRVGKSFAAWKHCSLYRIFSLCWTMFSQAQFWNPYLLFQWILETRTFGSAAKWVYLNGPVAILLITDLVFFLLTVKSLLQTVQQSHKGTVKRQARQRLKLCFKGFIIFLIFILKPKILHAVRERVCSLCCGQHQPRQQLRGRLTFTASVLSEFLSSTKRSHPPLSTHHLSTSSFSTSSPTLSWGSSLSASPATLQKPNKQQNYFYGRPNTASLKKDTNSNTRY
ncbi:hypothetical protein Anas_13197 [Armadillidium nasatum]|uniref:Uncharacterized protein n=1 Tax=Armadillidium nasatum TaxID=96803 RepID=A0A5N5SS78_9CRUS|nr:hypothetical protein Anas_13197 [Armadillidium nasatum]